MTYTWTQDQLKLLTYGSTVSVFGDECRVLEHRGGVLRVAYGEGSVAASVHGIDPSTLKPPSIEFIRELARERLGADAWIVDDAGVLDIDWDDNRREVRIEDTPSMDRFRAAVAAIPALAGAGLGGGK